MKHETMQLKHPHNIVIADLCEYLNTYVKSFMQYYLYIVWEVMIQCFHCCVAINIEHSIFWYHSF
jgi:hypothetical protein